MKYYYEAFTTRAEARKGEVEARSEEHAAGIIRNDLGLIAREISSKPLEEFKFDHQAKKQEEVKPYDPDEPVVEGLRLNPTPEDPETPEPAQPEVPEVGVSTKVPKGFQWYLARDLGQIAQVARQMEEWSAAAKNRKKDEELPSGHPAVGGITWQIYAKDRDEIIAGLIRAAMARAARI